MSDEISIVEVAPRDGLQADPAELDSDAKIELITRLIGAGHTRIEATSFVNPKAVPKMADCDAVMAGVPRPDGVRYSALAMNDRGVERALEAGVDEVTGVVVASETFSQKNQRASIAEAIERWESISAIARDGGARTSLTVAAAAGCPFEGEVPAERVVDIAERVAQTAPDEINLADTIGVGVPDQITALFTAIRSRFGGIALRGHFHNTRNTALANIVAAISAGVRTFDTSAGGVGGCPFAPEATGNVPTEDVVYMLHRMGHDTGIDLDAAIGVTDWLESTLGHGTPSLVAKAGGFPTGS